jgi:hypothetical protein
MVLGSVYLIVLSFSFCLFRSVGDWNEDLDLTFI